MERSLGGASAVPSSADARCSESATDRLEIGPPAGGSGCAPRHDCGSADGADLDLPASVRHDLRWIVGQIHHGYLAASVAAVGQLPGGMKGFYVLESAVEGVAHNQIEVARRFNIDRTVMVRLIDEMERAGLVERRPVPTDRRARMIVATELGVGEYHRARGALRAVDDHVLAPLAPEDRDAFVAFARLVSEHLVAMDPTKGAAACVAAEATMRAAAATEGGACGPAPDAAGGGPRARG
ncbi:MarR family winged helix-turn-helix transcriptional regulator [Parafrankia sp. CH37]|uniref:MarR family winged helix-turn-helix transcriptional regulator n=1 Tax=Parafrankia sp. CH37 TaxID=683308 RepID=UPI00289D1A2D|nr:MarR family winged helix-turn-helix transcriptional regulator [Parafrankia sp. CH37]